MAALSQIRKRTGLLIVVVGIAMVSFLLMDALSSNSGILQGDANLIGEINGKEITIQDFNMKLAENKENYKKNSRTRTINDQIESALQEQTWDEFVRENVVYNQYSDLGISVTSEELYDMIQGPQPHPQVVQNFKNPETGAFDRATVANYINQLDELPADNRDAWLNFEKFLYNDRLNTKYNNLVKKSVYMPKWMVEKDHEDKFYAANIDFAFIPYTDIPDEGVQVTDNDLKNYIKANAHKYQQDESRSFEFVVFNIFPTATDTQKVQQWINSEVSKFSETKDDSLYVKANSDIEFDNAYYTLEQLTTSVKDTLFQIEPGTVFGPYFEAGFYKICKVLDRKMIADSVKYRKIKINAEGYTDANSMFKDVDSIVALLNDGGDFAEIAAAIDPTVTNGGDMGWVLPTSLVKEEKEALFFRAEKGKVIRMVQPKAITLMEVTEMTPANEAVKVATVAREVNYSSSTEKAMFAKASKFAGMNQSLEEIRTAANETPEAALKIAENIGKNINSVNGMEGNARNIVRWAYTAKEGEVSKEVYTMENQFVVAVLTEINEEGTKNLDQVKGEVEVLVKNQKKAEAVKAAVGANASPEDVAAKYGKSVQNATNVSFITPAISGVPGSEPKMVATAVSLAKDQVCAPTAGEGGVFVLRVTSTAGALTLTDPTSSQRQLETGVQSRVDYGLFQALKDNADIKDNRHKIF